MHRAYYQGFSSSTRVVHAAVAVMLVALCAWAQDLESDGERDTYLRLGLSETEWLKIKEAGIPMAKVEELLKTGISIGEYCDRPWERLGMTEGEWVDRRRAGQTSEDIRLSQQRTKTSEWAVVHNFFLPGLHQFRRHQWWKGALMSGTAAGSLALFAIHKNPKDSNDIGFDYPIPYMVFLAGAMLWSSIDIGVQVYRENNKQAARFTMSPSRGGTVLLAMTFPVSDGE